MPDDYLSRMAMLEQNRFDCMNSADENTWRSNAMWITSFVGPGLFALYGYREPLILMSFASLFAAAGAGFHFLGKHQTKKAQRYEHEIDKQMEENSEMISGQDHAQDDSYHEGASAPAPV